MLGGHANYVADLKLDFDDPRSSVVASEICGTSISSLSRLQPRIAAARPFNPHVRHARADQRGYVRFSLDARMLQAQLRTVTDIDDPSSAVTTAASFGVEHGSPGAS